MNGKRTSTKPVEIGPEGPQSNQAYPEGWKQPGEPVLVSYMIEQRTLAAIVMMGGYVESKSGRTDNLAVKVANFGADLAASQVRDAIRQLERKNKLVVERSNANRFLRAVATTDDVTADDWAMNELRKLMLTRKRAAAAEVKVPDDYTATHPGKRGVILTEQEKLALEPGPEPKVEYRQVVAEGEPDYAKLADALLVQVMAKLNTPPPKVVEGKTREHRALQRDYDTLRKDFYNMEQEHRALKAQVSQLEDNVKAAVDAAKQLDEENRRLKEIYHEDEKLRNSRDRHHRLTELVSPESRALLKQLSEGRIT